MIPSLLFAFFGYILLAVVSILDKFILTKSVKSTAVYTFYSTIFFFILAIFIPFQTTQLIPGDIVLALFSGICFGFGFWTLFKALESGEASHIAPFVGTVTALSTFVLSAQLLGEHLGIIEDIGVFLLACGSLLFSFETTRKHRGFHKGFIWAAAAGILFSFSHLSAKYIYDLYPFFTGLIWTKASIGLVGLLTLLSPEVRKVFSKKHHKDTQKRTTPLLAIGIDKIAGVGGTLLIQYAIAIGSVTVVNALAGIQYAFVFLLAYVATRTIPKFFSEYFTRREIFSQSIAVLLVIIGSALFALHK